MSPVAPSTDPALWTTRRAYGSAGGPYEVVLTDEGHARAFSVGAQVKRGEPAEALRALSAYGGSGWLMTASGARLSSTALGAFDQVAWGYLKAKGYVESFDRDGVRLTETGRRAVDRGHAEERSLLERCRRAAFQAGEPFRSEGVVAREVDAPGAF